MAKLKFKKFNLTVMGILYAPDKIFFSQIIKLKNIENRKLTTLTESGFEDFSFLASFADFLAL